jgi:hypothetical protein
MTRSSCGDVTVQHPDGSTDTLPAYSADELANIKTGKPADTPRRRCEACRCRLPASATVRRRWCANCTGAGPRKQAQARAIRQEQP